MKVLALILALNASFPIFAQSPSTGVQPQPPVCASIETCRTVGRNAYNFCKSRYVTEMSQLRQECNLNYNFDTPGAYGNVILSILSEVSFGICDAIEEKALDVCVAAIGIWRE